VIWGSVLKFDNTHQIKLMRYDVLYKMGFIFWLLQFL